MSRPSLCPAWWRATICSRMGDASTSHFIWRADMPASQPLFIDRMDHSVCAIGPSLVACLPHKELLAVFNRRPSIAFAIWRETLIDAAIFREAITNNSARSMPARMGHLFCELFYRARASGLTQG